MKPPRQLRLSQLIERTDELQKLLDWAINLEDAKSIKSYMQNRLEALQNALDKKLQDNAFNKGVVNPLPPDHVDIDNPSVVSPKPPSQVEREFSNWQKSLD